MKYKYKPYYRRKLPHIHTPGSTLFVTFRLADAIPKVVLDQWLAEKAIRTNNLDHELKTEFHRRWFARFEEILHKAETGPTWLADSRIAQIVSDSLAYRDGRVYDLLSYCIMSNHVHSVFTPFLNETSVIEEPVYGVMSDDAPLPAIMQSLKGYTAYKANRVLGRSGQFWDEESYDHEVRSSGELRRIIRYVLNNPVKARLVQHWSEWKWSYCKWPEEY